MARTKKRRSNPSPRKKRDGDRRKHEAASARALIVGDPHGFEVAYRTVADFGLQRQLRVISMVRNSTRALKQLMGEPFPGSRTAAMSVLDLEATPNFHSPSLRRELNVAAAGCINNRDKLNQQLRARRRHEHDYLRGDLLTDNALTSLLDESSLTWTAWGVAHRFLMAERVGGLAHLSEVGEKVRGAVRTPRDLVLVLLELRADPRMAGPNFYFTMAAYRAEFGEPLASYLDAHAAPSLHPGDEAGLANALVWSRADPLLDRLDVLVLALEWCARTDPDGRTPVEPSLLRSLDESIDDPRLRSLTLLAGWDEPEAEEFDLEFLSILDDYTLGDYSSAAQRLGRLVDERPERFWYTELLARARIRNGKHPTTNTGLSGEVLSAMEASLRRSSGEQRSSLDLEATAGRHEHLAFGRGLRAFISSPGAGAPLGFGSSSTTLTPRSFDSQLARGGSTAALERALERWAPASPALKLRRWLSGADESPPPGLPDHRFRKYDARRRESRGDLSAAVELYCFCANDTDSPGQDRVEAADGFIRTAIALGDSRRAVATLSTLAVDEPHLMPPIANLPELVCQPRATLAEQDSDEAIRWALLTKLASSSPGVRLAEVAADYDDALEFHGVKSAADPAFAPASDPRLLSAFLSEVASSQEVLNLSMFHSSPEDILRERLEVLRRLSALNPHAAPAHAGRIAELSRASLIRSIVAKAEGGKIHVNVEGVWTEIDDSFRETHRRWRSVSSVMRHIPLLFLGGDTTNGDLDAVLTHAVQRQVLASRGETSRTLFVPLVVMVRNEFQYNNDYGLDTYLSTRIRHGTLARYLRIEFETAGILTTKLDGEYDPSPWIDKCVENDREPLDSALKRFGESVDTAIARISEDWVRIRNSDRPEGAFDFGFDATDYALLAEGAEALNDENEVFELIVSTMWDRVEHGLERLRARLAGEFRDEIMAKLDELSAAISSLDQAHWELVGAVATCRTNFQNRLASVTQWFTVADPRSAEPQPVRYVLEAAQRHYADVLGVPETQVAIGGDGDAPLRGDRLVGLLDLMWILLENAAKHSGSEDPETGLSVEVSDSSFSIEVSNSLADTVDVAALGTLADELEKRALDATRYGSEAVRSEGGSGYLKIGRILRNEFDSHLAITEVRVDDTRFTVRITIGASAMFHNE